MGRGFSIEEGGHGWSVVDDRGTPWAGFAPDNPDGPFLSGFVLALIEEAYRLGAEAGPSAQGGRVRLFRGRHDGLPTWDVRIDGPGGPCVARDGRHPLHPFPPRRARLMRDLARCAFEVAGADAAGSGNGATESLSIAEAAASMAG